MSVCTFFGHSECYGLDPQVLRDAIGELIDQGVREFLVGNQGQFDRMVFSCLRELGKENPEISYFVALAYLPTRGQEDDIYDGHSFYPEGLERALPRFAIAHRNRYLIEVSEICICYIDHTWGGAYRFASQAKRRGLTVINLGSAEITGLPRKGRDGGSVPKAEQ